MDVWLQVGEESAALNRELQILEQQSASSDRLSALVNETLQLYDQNSFHEVFQGNKLDTVLNYVEF